MSLGLIAQRWNGMETLIGKEGQLYTKKEL
jgi:hypothetical protein